VTTPKRIVEEETSRKVAFRRDHLKDHTQLKRLPRKNHMRTQIKNSHHKGKGKDRVTWEKGNSSREQGSSDDLGGKEQETPLHKKKKKSTKAEPVMAAGVWRRELAKSGMW